MSGRHYLDHASTTPLRPEAQAAIAAWLAEAPTGDPGRPYEEGRVVRDLVEQARSELALLLGVREREIVFTSSGTEATNASNHAVRHLVETGMPIACADVEHSSVRLGAESIGKVHLLPVDRVGRIDVDAVDAALRSDQKPALVHCQYANHEVATIQHVKDVVQLCREGGVAVHVDACAAIGHLPIDLGELGADFVSVSAHKFGGPPGVGALIVRRGRHLSPLLVGGEQERARRAGFENLIGLVGLGAVACALRQDAAIELMETRTRALTDRILHAAERVEGVVAFGDTDVRLPHIICLGVYGVEAEGVVLGLDQVGIAVHSGSACSSESFEPSPVLAAMGVDADRSLRCSVGWSTTDEDVDAFIRSFPEVVDSLRSLRRS